VKYEGGKRPDDLPAVPHPGAPGGPKADVSIDLLLQIAKQRIDMTQATADPQGQASQTRGSSDPLVGGRLSVAAGHATSTSSESDA